MIKIVIKQKNRIFIKYQQRKIILKYAIFQKRDISLIQIQMNNQEDKSIYFTPISRHPKWQIQIVPILINLTNEKYDEYQVIKVLKDFNERYCWRRKQYGQFRQKKMNNYKALYSLYKSDLVGLIKVFANALLQIRPQPIKMVMGQEKSNNFYKKKEIVYILLLMFFSLTPKLFSDGKKYLEHQFHDQNNLSYILSHHQFKTKCVVQYLKMAVSELINRGINQQVFSIVRNTLRQNLRELLSYSKNVKMGKYEILDNNRSIEQFNGQMKVDFANRFIGGGCLRQGCVQQQIMFAVRPELYVTTLLCQKMDHNEALGLVGFKRYFQYKGYSKTTEYIGKANIDYKLSQNLQTREYIVVIDALKYSKQGFQQFQKQEIDREIRKAYIGFSCLKQTGKIVSGGWGCGVYNGNFQLKFLIQWIAASMAERQLLICPFGRKKQLEENNLLAKIKNYSINQIYDLVLIASSNKLSKKYEKQSIFKLISMEINNDQ